MWICEIFSDANASPVFKLLKGPTITIGRKAECDISFPNDKSVSRNHAELLLEGNKLLVSDFGSKFCSYVISGISKVPVVASTDMANKIRVEVNHNDIVQIGATVSRIRFRNVNMELCPTKLDKPEKEELKKLAGSISGCKVVSNIIPSSVKPDTLNNYIVATKFVATVKILESIVYQYPIVNIRFIKDLVTLLTAPNGRALSDMPAASRCVCLANALLHRYPSLL